MPLNEARMHIINPEKSRDGLIGKLSTTLSPFRDLAPFRDLENISSKLIQIDESGEIKLGILTDKKSTSNFYQLLTSYAIYFPLINKYSDINFRIKRMNDLFYLIFDFTTDLPRNDQLTMINEIRIRANNGEQVKDQLVKFQQETFDFLQASINYAGELVEEQQLETNIDRDSTEYREIYNDILNLNKTNTNTLPTISNQNISDEDDSEKIFNEFFGFTQSSEPSRTGMFKHTMNDDGSDQENSNQNSEENAYSTNTSITSTFSKRD